MEEILRIHMEKSLKTSTKLKAKEYQRTV